MQLGHRNTLWERTDLGVPTKSSLEISKASKQSSLHAQTAPPCPTQDEDPLHLTRPRLSVSGLEPEESFWHLL